MSNLPRIALLLILLPQLLVLGLGRGVVLCIAPGGHVGVEIAASACCIAPTPAATTQDGDRASSDTEPDCGTCTDYGIVVLPSQRPVSLADGFEPPPDAPASEPKGFPILRTVLDRGHTLDPSLDRAFVPLHLMHLRSVLLRC